MIEAIFEYQFLRNAVISGIVIGFLAPILGVFLVVRRLSMIADALSHITLSGIAFHLLLGKFFAFFGPLNPIYMGMLFSVGGGLAIDKLRKTYKHYQELAIPIMLSTGIAFGVVFISIAGGFNTDLFTYLFGSIVAIRQSDMITIFAIGVIVLIVILLLYKELFSLSFDAENAKTTGIPGRMINLIFILMVALIIASAMRIVGILLVSALMVLPVASSLRLANSFKQTFLYAIIFGQTSVLTGLYLAFELDWAPGGTIVIISFIILLTIMTIQKTKDFFTSHNQRRDVVRSKQ
ncbi:metal ABC transporter permease [Caldalkalibacillus salinus]|uniref:metal ABC transporter permease n=1 Tax=Caldalkalibacillus salinus TaxID=2803787 RepID=UPI00192135B2|nr:metal ABC transporter permease [Caldalkalibacillus salinus]